jgi:hypothetical protein
MYLGKMVACKRPALSVYGSSTKVGRVESIAAEGESIIIQLQQANLTQIIYPDLEDFKDKVTLLSNGNTNGGQESDVFADI